MKQLKRMSWTVVKTQVSIIGIEEILILLEIASYSNWKNI